MKDIVAALALLTALPIRLPDTADNNENPGRAMWAYPIAGVAIGITLFVVALGLVLIARAVTVSPATVAGGLLPAALVLALWCLSTGGLHLDGWADCCDALLVPVARERRMEILHDPRLGSFGGIGLILLLLIKLAAIQGLLATLAVRLQTGAQLWPTARAILPLLVAPILARWALVVAAVVFPLARPNGMGAHFRRGAGRREVAIVTALAAIACAGLGATGLVLWFGAGLAMLALARLAINRLGGLTGDVYGATVEFTETAVISLACLLSGV